MTKRVTVSEANLPSAGSAEAFARLLLEREKAKAVGGKTIGESTGTADKEATQECRKRMSAP